MGSDITADRISQEQQKFYGARVQIDFSNGIECGASALHAQKGDGPNDRTRYTVSKVSNSIPCEEHYPRLGLRAAILVASTEMARVIPHGLYTLDGQAPNNAKPLHECCKAM